MMDMNNLNEVVGKYKVLYVEDDETVLLKVSKMFQEIFKLVDTAKNGLEGLAQYNAYFEKNNEHYDIVISDINMPKMNGIELSQEIRKISPMQEIFIISAHNESNVLQELINIGVSTFIHKPIKFDELLKSILKVHISLQANKQKDEKTDEMMKLNHEFEGVLNGYDSLIIASRTDTNGNITYVSQAFEKIFGYTKEELLGKNHSVIRHEDTKDEFYEFMWQTIKSGKIWKGKIRNKAKNGNTHWTKMSIAAYYDKEGNILGYNSIREDITAKEKAKELHRKVNILLRNATDGYLLIDQNMVVEAGYSEICTHFFSKHYLQGNNILDLLFREDDSFNKTIFSQGIEAIFQTEDKNKKEVLCSLLPTETSVNNKHFKIFYKVIDELNIMVIIRDISEEIALQNQLEIQNTRQKMIIQIVSNINDFVELKNSFESFLESIYKENSQNEIDLKNNGKQILRELHTYKGIFAQMFLCETPETIHNLETKVIEMIKTSKNEALLEEKENVKQKFSEDLEIFDQTIGKHFITEQLKIEQKFEVCTDLKQQLSDIILNPINTNFKVQSIIAELDYLSYISIYEILEKHVEYVEYLAEMLKKPVNSLKIYGDKYVLVPPEFRNFLKNLLHLYKNSVDHGIEDIETITEKGGHYSLNIVCEYFHKENYFYLNIYDDGMGVDIEKLVNKAIEKEIITLEHSFTLSDDEKLQLLFCDGLSTKDVANEISGRGVGMASLKQSCEELGGVIKVENKENEGLAFSFKIPIKVKMNYDQNNKNLVELMSILEVISKKITLFFDQDMGMNILDVRYVNETDMSNKIHSIIKLNDAITISFSYTKNIIKKYSELFLQDLFSSEEDYENSIEDISNEILNTLVGLSIQDLENKEMDTILTTPQNISEEQFNLLINNKSNKIVTMLIQTDLGNLICKTIQKV